MIGNAPIAVAGSEELTASSAASAWNTRLRSALVPALALVTALVFCAVLLLLAGHNPLKVYQTLWTGAVTGQSAFANTLVQTTPYILLGLSVAVGFKAGLFNIGAEGQYVMGAIGATWAAHMIPSAPAILLASWALLVGAVAGALYAMIAGVLKVLTGAHEVITTIMLNYVSYDLVTYLVAVGGPMNGNPNAEQSYTIPNGAHLPIIWSGTPLHAGLILALIVAAVIYVLVWRTTWGFELRAVGLNPQAARSAGISIRQVTVRTMAISGALAGLAGAIQATSLDPYLLPNPFASGFGFDAIAVALIGAGTPVGIVLAALLMGGLRNGATLMEQVGGVNEPFFLVIQATILFFVAAPIVIRMLYFRWPEYLSRLSGPRHKPEPPTPAKPG